MSKKRTPPEIIGSVGNAARVRRRTQAQAPPEPRIPAAIIIMQTHAYLLGQMIQVTAQWHDAPEAAKRACDYVEALIAEGIARGFIAPKEATP